MKTVLDKGNDLMRCIRLCQKLETPEDRANGFVASDEPEDHGQVKLEITLRKKFFYITAKVVDKMVYGFGLFTFHSLKVFVVYGK